MGHIILVTGGSRSGKSRYAENLANSITGKRSYIATCPALDDELRVRIARHKRDRSGRGWQTIEEQLALSQALESTHSSAVVLIDCLTLWINNLQYHSERSKQTLDEDTMRHECLNLIAASRSHPGLVIMVTNEVGFGIVPDNPTSRLFRDLSGRCNTTIAEKADQVTLVCCGLPLHLKGPPKTASWEAKQ